MPSALARCTTDAPLPPVLPQVRYPATLPALDAPTGRTYVALFGAHQSGLEVSHSCFDGCRLS